MSFVCKWIDKYMNSLLNCKNIVNDPKTVQIIEILDKYTIIISDCFYFIKAKLFKEQTQKLFPGIFINLEEYNLEYKNGSYFVYIKSYIVIGGVSDVMGEPEDINLKYKEQIVLFNNYDYLFDVSCFIENAFSNSNTTYDSNMSLTDSDWENFSTNIIARKSKMQENIFSDNKIEVKKDGKGEIGDVNCEISTDLIDPNIGNKKTRLNILGDINFTKNNSSIIKKTPLKKNNIAKINTNRLEKIEKIYFFEYFKNRYVFKYFNNLEDKFNDKSLCYYYKRLIFSCNYTKTNLEKYNFDDNIQELNSTSNRFTENLKKSNLSFHDANIFNEIDLIEKNHDGFNYTNDTFIKECTNSEIEFFIEDSILTENLTDFETLTKYDNYNNNEMSNLNEFNFTDTIVNKSKILNFHCSNATVCKTLFVNDFHKKIPTNIDINYLNFKNLQNGNFKVSFNNKTYFLFIYLMYKYFIIYQKSYSLELNIYELFILNEYKKSAIFKNIKYRNDIFKFTSKNKNKYFSIDNCYEPTKLTNKRFKIVEKEMDLMFDVDFDIIEYIKNG